VVAVTNSVVTGGCESSTMISLEVPSLMSIAGSAATRVSGFMDS